MALTKVPSNLDSITATTQSQGDGSTNVATTAYVDTGLANLIDSAPGNLNTLNELAAAMNDNASFFSTVLPLSGGTLTGDLILGDSVQIELGDATGGDLRIYHDGSHSVIANHNSSGRLDLRGATIGLKNTANSEYMIQAVENGAVTLYHDGSPKLATVATGIDVTGTVIADGGTFDGLVGINKAVNAAVGLSVGADATSTTSYGLEVTNSTANTRFLVNGEGSSFFYKTDNSEGMRFDATSGNVGIGTTSPSGRLMVREDTAGNPARLIISNGGTAQSGTTSRLSFYEGTAEKSYIERKRDNSGITAFVTPADDNPFVWENASGEFMRFTNSKVGIGTTSPSSLLHMESGNAHNKLSITSTASGGTGYDAVIDLLGSASNSEVQLNMGINGDADREQIKTYQSAMSFRTNNAERVRIDPNGHVAFKTTDLGYPDYGDDLTIADSGHCGMTIRSGTSSNGTLYFSDDTGTAGGTYAGKIAYEHANNKMLIATNTQNRIAIDSGGNVGIGTTSPSFDLDIQDSSNTYLNVQATATSGEASLALKGKNSSGTDRTLLFKYDNADKFRIATPSAVPIVFETSDAERMRIVSNGQICFNSTEIATNDPSCGFNPNSNTGAELFFTRPSTYSGTGNSILNYHGGSYIGGINTSTSATSFLTSSDYRLKENVNYKFDALARVKQLKPARFNFIIEKDKTVDGFIAHEVSDIVPEAIVGEKDGKQIQAIDQSKLVPLLTKAIQEQQEIIDDLKTRIETLEG